MKELYVVNCCRTAVGSFGGSLKKVRLFAVAAALAGAAGAFVAGAAEPSACSLDSSARV